MFLLDTNVVSELRKPKPHGGVLAWIRTVPDTSLFISAVTLGEIQRSIERIRPQDPAKAVALDGWADEIAATSNILPMTDVIFRLWAKLMQSRAEELYEDIMLAATAKEHGLTLATRNVRDFKGVDVKVANPFEYAERQ